MCARKSNAVMDVDILLACKLAGIHIARNDREGSFLQVFNYENAIVSEQEMFNKKATDILPGCPYAQQILHVRQEVAKTGRSVTTETQTPLLKIEGYAQARLVVVPRYESGEIVGSTSLFVDISDEIKKLAETNARLEKKQAEMEKMMKTLSETNQKLEQLAKAKSEFLALMSHELRTPLNGVLGMLQVLQASGLTAEQTEATKVMFQSGQTLLRIIGSILDYSKLETGNMDLEEKVFDIRQVIDDARKLVAARHNERINEFVNAISADIPLLMFGDEARLFQVYVNLLNNAAKFTDKGMIKTRVLKTNHTSSHLELKIRFEVEDNGIGISQDFVPQLFQPFSQENFTTSRIYGGTGLGLAICKKLVEKMGGSIGATTEKNKGSIFWFTIKLAIPTPEQKEQAAHSPSRERRYEVCGDNFDISDICDHPKTATAPTTTESKDTVTAAPISVTVKSEGALEMSVSMAAPLPVPTVKSTTATVSVPKKRCLVVEDNLINQKVIVRMLERLDLDIDVANDGQQAVDTFKENPCKYDIIFMDCMMPVKDGPQATKEIREHELNYAPKKPRVPIIAVTAHVMFGAEEYYKTQGMDAYLPKPIVMKDLKKVVQRFCY